MTDSSLTARFLEGARGSLLVTMRRPRGAATGPSALVVPPFGEEMNKSRRMIAEVARTLAARGVATVLPDLFGTGDSAGEFDEATWEIWQDDVTRAAAWAASEGWAVSGLFCVRLGCVLGAELARDRLPGIRCTVFWQPVTDGERFLNQFLRLRVAASMMDSQKRESAGELRKRLQQGESLEVAGYKLSARLAQDIDALRLTPALGPHLGELHWMEVVRDAAAPLPGASSQVLEAATAAQVATTVHQVAGEPFWSSTEIVQIAQLVERTAGAFTCLQ